jgi:hypothetical protein
MKKRYHGTMSYQLQANPEAFAKFAKELRATQAAER